MRKKALVFILILSLLQTGCWNAREINELGFVLSIGLDKSENGFKVTAQIASPETYSKTPTGSASAQKTKPFWIVVSKGRTIFEAIRNMAAISSRRIFWAHIKVILINEDLARSNTPEIVDFFSRNVELRLRTLIAVTPEEAGKLIQIVPEMEKDPASYLEKIIENKNLTGKSASIMLKDFLDDYLSPNTGPIASRIIIDNSQPTPVLKTSGAYVFDGNKLAGSLNEDQTRGLLWIKNKIKDTIMVAYCPEDNKPVSIEIKNAKSSVKVNMDNNIPHYTINISANANVTEQACNTDFNDAEELKKLSKRTEEGIRKDIESSITVAKDMKIDFIEFSRTMHRQQKDRYHEIKANWDEYFLKSEVTMNINVDINHVSLAKPLEPMKVH